MRDIPKGRRDPGKYRLSLATEFKETDAVASSLNLAGAAIHYAGIEKGPRADDFFPARRSPDGVAILWRPGTADARPGAPPARKLSQHLPLLRRAWPRPGVPR